jgi:hypothetical protein
MRWVLVLFMREDPIDRGRISNRSRAVGVVTWDMVRKRAREIAITNGRGPYAVLDSDFDQARRELTTLEDEPVKEQFLESVPESERWDPVPGSFGRVAPKYPPLNQEETDGERLTREGVEDAEHDQMVKGSIEEARRDEEGG